MELFRGSESHPADDARANAVGMMLDAIGCAVEAGAIRQRWDELVQLSNESAPQRYALAYSDELLRELTDFFHAECTGLGLRVFEKGANDVAPVTAAVNDAWREFRENPDTFGKYEQAMLRTLIEGLG